MGGAVACHSKKDCWEVGGLVQVKDNEGKSKAIVVGVGIREKLEGDMGCWDIRDKDMVQGPGH